jgi:GNAT superfamily N-acetyltransferase
VQGKCQEGKGLGELLLLHALMRAQRIYNEAGGIGLFVDAIDARAADYYRRFGFAASPDNPLMLFLSFRVLGQPSALKEHFTH